MAEANEDPYIKMIGEGLKTEASRQLKAGDLKRANKNLELVKMLGVLHNSLTKGTTKERRDPESTDNRKLIDSIYGTKENPILVKQRKNFDKYLEKARARYGAEVAEAPKAETKEEKAAKASIENEYDNMCKVIRSQITNKNVKNDFDRLLDNLDKGGAPDSPENEKVRKSVLRNVVESFEKDKDDNPAVRPEYEKMSNMFKDDFEALEVMFLERYEKMPKKAKIETKSLTEETQEIYGKIMPLISKESASKEAKAASKLFKEVNTKLMNKKPLDEKDMEKLDVVSFQSVVFYPVF